MHSTPDRTGYLEVFFEEVKSAGFFKRLFSWSKIQAHGYEAYKEYALLVREQASLNDRINDLLHQLEDQGRKDEFSGKENDRLKSELTEARASYKTINDRLTECEKTITEFQTSERSRLDDYQSKVSSLNTLMNQVKEDQQRLLQEREQTIRDKMEEMKKTWSAHEARVEETIRGLCKKHQVEYLQKDKVPFKGKPDNTLLICQEYVVFDAKSPEGDDLSNFPDYVKSQAEKASKYVKEKDVRKEIFLVVPSNTIHIFDAHSINLGEYRAYIITVDSLEPIILSLKKIEDYEFADQLSPEERDDICRIIGRLSHLTKRRIQVDTFFCEEFFDALKSCRCLPEDLAQKALDYEKSTKVNPPVEQRAKLISDKELENALETVQKGAAYLDLDTTEEVTDIIQEMPLMKEKRGNQTESKD
jgi:hypothetical protein